ncbi:hypothetical protein O1M63_47210 [Streptomyces mirabilis]|nr:hypothetical protein [Streptomyces mirabilis]
MALNGIVLFISEQLWRGATGRRRAGASTVAGEEQRTPDELSDQRITGMTMRQAMAIGVAHGLRGPLLAGSLAAFVAAYLATRYLVRYFENRTLIPFAVYCTLAGFGSLAYFTIA